MYGTTTTNLGNTGMQLSSTRVKAPVFYVTVGEYTYEWLAPKHSKMFDAVQKSEGKDCSKLKVIINHSLCNCIFLTLFVIVLK